jgi:DNA-binding transcriptional LysR family regulator
MSINMTQVKAFMSVATFGSFTKAAEALNLTQSNLSMQVAALERGYNIKLLERTRGDIKPTPIGRSLFEIAKQIFALQDEALALVKNTNEFDKGTIRIGSDSPVTIFPYINAFKATYPNIELSLYLGSGEEVVEALKTCKIDVALMSEPQMGVGYKSIPIKQSGLACVFLATNPMAMKKRIMFKDLNDQSLVMRMEGSRTRMIFDAASRLACFKASVALEVSSREGVLEAVLNNLGIGIIWQKEFNGDPRLRVVPLDVKGGLLNACFVYQTERENRGLLRAFLGAIDK